MKQLMLEAILPDLQCAAYGGANDVMQRVAGLLKSGNNAEAAVLIDNAIGGLGSCNDLCRAWMQLAKMWICSNEGNYASAIGNGIDVLHTLVSIEDRKSVEFLSMLAATVYLLAFAHYNTGENKKAEKELEKSQKLYERLAKKNNDRFTPALMTAVEASTAVFKSKIKKMNVLAHYQVATELYQSKVSAGVTDAIVSLVESISAEGDIHLKMGNYRDAVKFYTKALRYQKRISASMGLKELQISVNLGKALLQLSNRRSAGEQLLRSILPLAERMDATAEAEEIKSLLSDLGKNTFDIMAFWKKLFVVMFVMSATMVSAQTMIGHRGSVWGVENTAVAFINGIKHAGYDGLECDIRTSADGTFIVNHDASLARIGGDSTAIACRNAYDILSDHLVQTRDGITYEGSAVTLGQFLDLCIEFDCTPVVEIKECWNIYSNDNTGECCYSGVPALIDLIRHKGLADRVVIISFMAGVIDHISKNYPDIRLQYLTGGNWRDALDFCKERKIDIDIISHQADAELVKTFHDMGLKVNTWTVDDPAEFKRLQEIGVDMITTNKIIK